MKLASDTRTEAQAAETKTQLLEYQFSGAWGSLVIKVDREEVKRSVHWFGPMREAAAETAGKKAPMEVRIEQEHWFPFGRKSSVFINERLVKCLESI